MSTAEIIILSFFVLATIVFFYTEYRKPKRRKPMATMNKSHKAGIAAQNANAILQNAIAGIPSCGKLMSGKEAKAMSEASKTRAKADIVNTVRRKINELESLIEEPKPAPKKKPKAMTAPIIPKGWKRHDGDECPVKKLSMVDVMLRDGSVHKNQQAWGLIRDNRECKLITQSTFASSAFWEQDNHGRDIIAYRIVKPKRKPQTRGKGK